MRKLSLGVALALAASAQGCSGDLGDSAREASAAGAPGTGASGPTGAGGGAQTGLPCDVAAVLANNCLGCHGHPPAQSVPLSLVTYDELAATSPKGGTNADRALARMKDTMTPMPPLPGSVPQEDVAVFEAWVNSGTPKGDCANVGGSGGGGNPYDTPEVCTCADMPLGQCTWTQGNHESPDMHPGVACIACHAKDNEAPKLTVAGTLYPTAHEPDDCFGYSGKLDGTVVEVTDASMKVYTLDVRVSGNFYYEGAMAMPISARVIRGDQVRQMAQKITTGDCNSCHTLAGTGMPLAPGRIMAP